MSSSPSSIVHMMQKLRLHPNNAITKHNRSATPGRRGLTEPSPSKIVTIPVMNEVDSQHNNETPRQRLQRGDDINVPPLPNPASRILGFHPKKPYVWYSTWAPRQRLQRGNGTKGVTVASIVVAQSKVSQYQYNILIWALLENTS